MFVTLGWVLLAGLPLSSSTSIDTTVHPPARRITVAAPGRVAVWADQDDPYRRGQAARVYLGAERPAHVAVFRVDTDGRLTVLFPREPWGETYVRQARELEVTGGRGGRSFIVDDYPGVGYLFAIASAHPFDFEDIARGDYWDYRLIEGGRIRGDPYVVLTDLAARIAPGGDYDYDISPYYVERRYDYPRFVCYDCHAYAKYDEWDPYRQACARFRVVIYDDPRFYPYRSGEGRNVVMSRPVRPGPRFVFRDADPRRHYVTRVRGSEPAERRGGGDAARTSQDVGGRGSVPAPGMSFERPAPRTAPPLRAVPSRPVARESTPEERRRTEPVAPEAAPKGLRAVERTRRPEAARKPRPEGAAKPRPEGAAKPRPEPQSTGEPELRRRKP
ncbi:MAG: DUF4384 domain-containing protein [Gemmatimonadales bacterium]|nr:DUF4384 domain-containing protein [Gemmatimonadales bacterium]